MSELWRIHDEPEAVKRPDEAFYSEKGWLVPVEPVGTLTVEGEGFWLAGLRFSHQLPPGKYRLIPVEADDE